jgi:predicted ribosome quality control (RQC) complex YloA/Tae2 family protein
LGPGAGKNLTTGNRNIDIGNDGVAGEAATIRIGTDREQTRTFIAAISGVAVSGTGVVVNAGGQLGVAASSARFKKDIKPMDNASEAILGLKPVSFHYKKDIDPAGTLQFGLVAEEVQKVNPDLVVHDKDGKPYTVRYEAVDAMLLNEFLKEHRKVEELTKDFQATVAQLTARLNEQATQIQKVSAQLEASKPAPQVVNNP